ncbi:MAG: tetratricopeptide repeat protein [Helicobacteraceae bacterium]|jgi:tetratricopeptide (TPR) repeat protein|nr:tetratricopeptide repeat protein [Helicobacteraceae bacterium]
MRSSHFSLTAGKLAFLIAIVALLFSNVYAASDNSKTFLNRGNEAIKDKDYQTAISDYTKAIQIDPNNADAYYFRGFAYYKIFGDLDKAIPDFTKAIKIDPNNARAYVSRGNVYDSLGDHNKAIADYTKAIEIDPNNVASAYSLRGSAYANLRDYEKATKDAREACDLGDCKLLKYMIEKNQLRE